MPLLFALGLLVAGCSAHGVRHRVQPGQTLYRISQAYGVSVDDLARSNHLSDPAAIKAGDSLWIPGVEQQRTVSVPAKPVSKVSTTTPRSRKSAQPVPSTTTSTLPQSRKPTRAKSPPSPVSAQSVQLRWPVRGTVIESFAGNHKKGIEIAVSSGSVICSAAAGKVIYAGSGIAGYGFLIIVQHNNDISTVYGYNSKLLVSEGEYVGAGQKIAISGVAPGQKRGSLHFEVRQGKNAVDPVLYLSRA